MKRTAFASKKIAVTPKKITRKFKKVDPEAIKKTVVFYIIDESGSMGENRDETISGFNTYIRGLKESKFAKNTFITLTKFNTKATVVHNVVPVSEVPELTKETYSPHGWTALYDSIGVSIQAFEDAIKEKKLIDYRVVAMIMTDGRENASKEYSLQQVNNLINERQNLGNWTFTFLGADQSAWAVAASLGISKGNTTAAYSSRHGVVVNKNTRQRMLSYLANPTIGTTSNFMSNLDTTKEQSTADIPTFEPATAKDESVGTEIRTGIDQILRTYIPTPETYKKVKK